MLAGEGQTEALIFLLGFANDSHQAEMVGIDQSQTRNWLKLSVAVRINCH